MLCKIKCNPMHPDLCGALPEPYVPAWVTRGALVPHRYTYTPPRCRTSRHHRTFIPLSVSLWNDLDDSVCDVSISLWNDLDDSVCDVWDWQVSRAGPMSFYWPSCSLPFCLLLFSFSLLSFYGLVLWGWGLLTDRVLIALSQPCIAIF